MLQAINEGGGAAPGSYEVLAQRPDVLVRSPTDVIEAETLTIMEKIYGVVFSFTMPLAEWKGIGSQGEGALLAGWVQEIGGHEHVIGLSYTQDVNASGLLRDEMVIVVGTDDGSMSVEITWPLRTLNSPAAFGAIQDAWAALNRNAQGG